MFHGKARFLRETVFHRDFLVNSLVKNKINQVAGPSTIQSVSHLPYVIDQRRFS